MDQRTRIALESQNPWWSRKPFDRGIERLARFPGIVKVPEYPGGPAPGRCTEDGYVDTPVPGHPFPVGEEYTRQGNPVHQP